MDKRYEVFCLVDRYFYETPDRLSTGSGSDKGSGASLYEPAQRPVPEGWRTGRSGDWLHFTPVDGAGVPRPGSPPQGWKIHVSACLENAEKTIAKVWDHCVPRGIPFKFVPGPYALHLRNSKYAGRASSGKCITIYPSDDEQLHTILRELEDLLGGEAGPYILSDLRWNQGPLYVRYGGFVQRYCVDGSGVLVSAVEDGDGVLVPDRREPAFHIPPWVTLPAFLQPHLDARNATTTNDLPYRIESALHFSNGGGVYTGQDVRTGEKVVLKEARPYAGLAADGADAVARLEREKTALERLSGLGIAPEVRDWFVLGDHRFLVMDFLEGRTLNSFFAQRHPLISIDPDPTAVADYTDWALGIHAAVEEAVAAVHSRGVVFNDLHMFNIMVGPDERSVSLLDFEAAAHIDEHTRQALAHPGFIAPADRRGFEVDRYALACLRLALFLPMTTLLVVDRDKAVHLADVIAEQFPVPREFLDEAVETITGTSPTTRGRTPYVPVEPADWPRSRDSMVAAILASATPERDDRLFPGDVAQFSDGGGIGLAHGAAGVLYALAETGAERYEAGEEWLLRHTDPPPPGTLLGLYDGLLGTAFVLDRLGHTPRALDLTERVLGENWQRLVPDLYGGLAGVGLALEHLSRTTGESGLRDRAVEAAQLLADRLAGEPGTHTGLLRGATGSALLFLRLYERTGAPELLDLAATALRQDLAKCGQDREGTWLVNEGFRTMPYLGAGSVGIGMVLDDYLAHRPDEEFERARAGILPAARSRYYAQPGLFNGRAGMILHLGRTTAPDAAPGHLAAQIAALSWYAMPYQGQLAFPGDQMMRLSMDLNTGTAGCLLALGAALGEQPAALPFLPPLTRPQSSPFTGAGTTSTPSP
ncbi:class III lanthionine synthetase LanKC [Streptomyces sp. RKAG337]|uniref:class III lanthionine synthetase LanKC n=1 Tax=Streptomyces sp. RKAG337 TaxID=2893404 RepID=UPI002033AAF4|nr:class III lanthionine synthetase LanKC [Streptomyces sp. RKAG337]MCM2428650.1 class III lanthionine synthetase LanKC [Streptomyces sp. RKAG337]